MNDPQANRVLALAGVFQALEAVREIATQGASPPEHYKPCVQALLAEFEGEVAPLYGGIPTLKPGLRTLIRHLEQPADAELSRHLIMVLHLERRLQRRKAVMAELTDGLGRARNQAAYFHSGHENVISNLADLYQRTVSTVGPRIMVRGERHYLEDPRSAALVRVLLLAALRGVSLWRACGGSRLSLLLRRKSAIAEARHLLH
ncbi:high frequency lysogenization protein HflD [Ectothiorhodospiraceae bacterium WFHF3C12]|nr:high frequency lysogenization protein HflD [Ectothiorhodospiraceae bacterium WFHF3C12]